MRIVVGNTKTKVLVGGADYLVDHKLMDSLRAYMSVKVPGSFFAAKKLKYHWDGMKYFITPGGAMATGFLPTFLKFIDEEYPDLQVEIIDERENIPVFRKEFISQIGDRTINDQYIHQKHVIQSFNNSIVFRGQSIYFPRGVADAATNAGKTAIIAGTYLNIEGDQKMLVIIHLKTVYRELLAYFQSIFGEVGEINADNYNIKPVTLAMIQTLYNRVEDINVKKDLSYFTIVAVDECFAPDTLVDGKPISSYSIGDYVYSYNHHTNRVEKKKVTYVYKTPVSTIIEVTFSNGMVIYTTPNHPFYSINDRTYVEISKLITNFVPYIDIDHYENTENSGSVIMPTVWGYDLSSVYEEAEETAQQKKDVLQRGMSGFISESRGQRKGIISRIQQKICFRKDETEKSYAQCSKQGENEDYIESYKPQTENTWGKWHAYTSMAAIIGKCFRVGYGSICITAGNAFRRISIMLQNRYSQCSVKNSYRSRRPIPLLISKAGTRQKEDFILGKIRVESIKIHKQGSGDRFGQVCREGYVYNLEVEDNNNYFASGILVHNCHRASADQYVGSLVHCSSASIRLFVSGSAFSSSDIVSKMIIVGQSGPKLINVSKKELMDKGISTPVKVKIHLCNTILQYPVISKDECMKAMIHESTERASLMLDIIRKRRDKGPILVAVQEIKHGEFLLNYFSKHGGVSRKGGWDPYNIELTHSKDKNIIQRVDAFRTGDIDVLISTGVLREGVNLPLIQTVIYALGGESGVYIRQWMGRGERVDASKTEVEFHDFCDVGRYTLKNSLHRLKIYKEENLDIEMDFEMKDVKRLSNIVINPS